VARILFYNARSLFYQCDNSAQGIACMVYSICIVRLSALGDVLMLVPLIRMLQTNVQCSYRITWIISRPAYDLVHGMDGVEFIVIDKPRHVLDLWRFRQQLKGRIFDILLATQASLGANLLYPFIHAKRKIGYDRVRAKDGHWLFIRENIAPGAEHTLEGFLKFAQVLGITPTKNLVWNLPIGIADYQWAYAHLPSDHNMVMIVNPAASKPERSWLAEHYAAMINIVQTCFGMRVVLTGGPSMHDRVLANQILQQVDCIDLVGKTQPKQLLAVIKIARLVVCPDTGPAHMATAVGTPVIALHAVTDPNVSGPYNYRHLAVDCYPAAVANMLQTASSRRCNNNQMAKTVAWGTKVHGRHAMSLITVEQVMRKINQIL
jgi:heptosyltransferase I